jgi:hypothetical protein
VRVLGEVDAGPVGVTCEGTMGVRYRSLLPGDCCCDGGGLERRKGSDCPQADGGMASQAAQPHSERPASNQARRLG